MKIMCRQLDRTDDPANILKRLGSQDGPAREAAEDQLYRLGPKAGDLLLSVVRKEKRKRTFKVLGMIGLALFVAAVRLHMHKLSVLDDLPFFSTIVLGLVGAMCMSELWKSAVGVLARLDDIRAIGTLLEARRYREMRKAADTALIRLLPRLKASDGLSPAGRALMHRLDRTASPALLMAAVAALRQVGDESDMPFLVRLTSGEGFEATDEVRADAAECLGDLRERAKWSKDRRTLLRPAEAPADVDVLLRPARPGVAVNTDLLLRPAETQEVAQISAEDRP